MVRHRAFVFYVTATTLLASALAGVETMQPLQGRWTSYISGLGDLVLLSFTIELLIRLVAERGRLERFFSDPWNWFDTVIVAVGYLPFVLPNVAGHPYLVFRAVRIVWTVRLFGELPGLQRLINALVTSLPSIASVFVFVFLHIYVYSVVGVTLFRAADPVHFGSLGEAMLSMFQVLTVEGWGDMMRAVRAHTTLPDIVVVLFFVSFLAIGAMVFLNLLIGILTDELRTSRDAAQSRVENEQPALDADAEVVAELEQLEASLAALRDRLARRSRTSAVPPAANDRPASSRRLRW